MRYTKTVSIWPVGLVGDSLYEAPLVVDGHVVQFYSKWRNHRAFPTDMASFAINLELIRANSSAYFSNNVPCGHQETLILTSLGVTKEMLEPKANNCSEILIWHTRSQIMKLNNEKLLRALPPQERVEINVNI